MKNKCLNIRNSYYSEVRSSNNFYMIAVHTFSVPPFFPTDLKQKASVKKVLSCAELDTCTERLLHKINTTLHYISLHYKWEVWKVNFCKTLFNGQNCRIMFKVESFLRQSELHDLLKWFVAREKFLVESTKCTKVRLFNILN